MKAHPGKSENLGADELPYRPPDWARNVIWYQIFPERFYNGDPNNDPTRERIDGPEGWEISPWTGDWYERAEWEKSSGGSFLDSVFKRRYGGDLQGVIDKLDYLKELGIGALYLNPVFDAVSLHKYDTSYYHHVDRFFGPDPKGDSEIMEREDPNDPATWLWTSADELLLKLIREVHKRDMKIILDGVFNHTGTDFWAFRDLKVKQEASEFKDWYSVKSLVGSEDTVFEYDGWWGVESLPEFREVDGTLVKPVRDHIFAVTRRWMAPDGDPAGGIDGWRLDVPQEIGKSFWKEWSALVREIKPNAYTVGEVWTTKGKEWVSGELFTAVMNYPFTEIVQKYMIDLTLLPSEFLMQLHKIREGFPDGAEQVLQNLMESHDTPRLASMIVNPGREFDKKTRAEEGFKVRKPNREERRIQKLIALFQYTYVGTPMLFYGTEAGMWGANDPDNRKPMVWEEFDYRPEKNHPLGEKRKADDNNFDADLFRWYKKLGQIRNKHLVLRTGYFQELLVDNQRNVIAFARFLNKQMFAIIVMNRSGDSCKIQLPQNHFKVKEGKHLEDLISGKQVSAVGEEIDLMLPALSGVILSPET